MILRCHGDVKCCPTSTADLASMEWSCQFFCVPQFLDSSVQSWNDVALHFERMVFDPDDVDLKIISQVPQ